MVMESSDVPNAQPELFGIIDGTNSYMYEELWKLCAGSLCDLPKIGEKVYYFLQGHIELVEACTKSEELDHAQPLSIISSKLRCRVFNIQLKAEKDTNEVYAEITLMPDTLEPNTTEFIIPTSSGHHQQRPNIQYFTKVLTPSDISTHGGLLIPKKHADNFPPLNNGEHIPSQDLLAKDIHDQTWNFKHSFTGKPQRHILTTGWNAFTTAKKLVVGDGLIFLRGETGELRVGIKRTGHQQNNIPLSLISLQTIRDGVIAYAKQAFDNQCLFSVVYKPRSSQFVVSYEKYVNAMNNKFNVGSKFLMRFEGADISVKRCSGTVIGINNFSPHWKESEWRSLQVQWDDLASFSRPDKVSPWEIEHLLPSANVPESTLLKNKRSRLVNEIGSSSTNFWIPTLIEGQEFGQPSTSSSMNVHKLDFCEATKDSQSASDWLMSYPIPAMSEAKSTNDQMILPINEKITPDPTISCRLFGFDLTTPSKTKCLTGPIDSYQKSGIPKYSEEKSADKTETQESPKEINNKQFKSTRSCTKVQVQGLTTEKAVDLSAFDGYNHLIHELEKIFDFKDELQTRNQWEIVFTDNEGDLMLVGDDPWPQFCDIVKKIFICSKEEVKKLKSTTNFLKHKSNLSI